MAKKGGTFVCLPCGMEIVITESGAAYSEIICCGEVMEPAAKKKAPARKTAGKKAPAKKTARKKAARKK